MPSLPNTKTDVYNQFFAPILKLRELVFTRVCPVLSDLDWLQFGILRVVSIVASGRDFLQSLAPRLDDELTRSHYFETLKSPRRLALVREAVSELVEDMKQEMPDLLEGVYDLEEFDVFGGDGHWHEHAIHDKSKPRRSGKEIIEAKYAVGHIYGINFRTRALIHLAHCDEVTRNREHDMHVLKRLDTDMLRQNAPKGRKVLWVWDRAGIDFRQWHKWKQSKGIYFLSRAKSNMNLDEVAPDRWDRNDPVNIGVEEDGIIIGGPQVMIRLIRYTDPLTGEHFEFITNEMTLRPGVLAQLYRKRWDIEKAFDDFKNKLGELKAWASSSTAKTMQAQFLCLAHNLLLLHEMRLEKQHGITNTAENRRRAKRLEKDKARTKKAGKQLPELYLTLSRSTQIPSKFIRWLRIHLFQPTSWQDAHATLRRCFAHL